MGEVTKSGELTQKIDDFLRQGFSPKFGQFKDKFESNNMWQKVKHEGTELWLDTGNIEDADRLWTSEFTALTTNNTLLNKEIQSGRYDSLVSELMNEFSELKELSEDERKLELAFILNAYHGLRLVEKFDAFVSVEEHTDLANDLERATWYGERYYNICPERFIIKLPFTAAGVLATRRLSQKGIPVNHTLGFAARQNYFIARIGKPSFVNVFLGRLNSLVVDNELGSGEYVGEKATLASQTAVKELRGSGITETRQIAASLRNGEQINSLVGVDLMTMPVKAAEEFLALGIAPDDVADRTESDYTPGVQLSDFNVLWEIDDDFKACIEKLEKENLDSFTADDLIGFFHDNGFGDFLVEWTESQKNKSTEEGKIPKLSNWKDELAGKKISLDSLMNLAGLMSFTGDQKAMDERVKDLWNKSSS